MCQAEECSDDVSLGRVATWAGCLCEVTAGYTAAVIVCVVAWLKFARVRSADRFSLGRRSTKLSTVSVKGAGHSNQSAKQSQAVDRSIPRPRVIWLNFFRARSAGHTRRQICAESESHRACRGKECPFATLFKLRRVASARGPIK